MRRVPALAFCLALSACGEANMRDQPRAKTWDANRFFPQGMTMRDPVPGTVPRTDPARYVPGRPASTPPCWPGAASATASPARPVTVAAATAGA